MKGQLGFKTDNSNILLTPSKLIDRNHRMPNSKSDDNACPQTPSSSAFKNDAEYAEYLNEFKKKSGANARRHR